MVHTRILENGRFLPKPNSFRFVPTLIYEEETILVKTAIVNKLIYALIIFFDIFLSQTSAIARFYGVLKAGFFSMV